MIDGGRETVQARRGVKMVMTKEPQIKKSQSSNTVISL